MARGFHRRYVKCPGCGKRRVYEITSGVYTGCTPGDYHCDACGWYCSAHEHANRNDQEGLAQLADANPELVEWRDGHRHILGALILTPQETVRTTLRVEGIELTIEGEAP